MHGYYSPDDPTGSTLAEHLARLRRTFGVIASRLRETVAQAIGQTVSRIVQQVVRTFLSRSRPGPEPPVDDWDRSPDRDLLWEDRADDHRWRDELHADPEYDRDPFPSPEPSPPVSDQSSLWRGVAVLICRVASWWLQRRRWPYPIMTALGIGLIAGVAAYAGGPLAAAGTAMSLATLTDLVDSSAAIAFTRSP